MCVFFCIYKFLFTSYTRFDQISRAREYKRNISVYCLVEFCTRAYKATYNALKFNHRPDDWPRNVVNHVKILFHYPMLFLLGDLELSMCSLCAGVTSNVRFILISLNEIYQFSESRHTSGVLRLGERVRMEKRN